MPVLLVKNLPDSPALTVADPKIVWFVFAPKEQAALPVFIIDHSNDKLSTISPNPASLSVPVGNVSVEIVPPLNRINLFLSSVIVNVTAAVFVIGPA